MLIDTVQGGSLADRCIEFKGFNEQSMRSMLDATCVTAVLYTLIDKQHETSPPRVMVDTLHYQRVWPGTEYVL